MSAEAPRVQCPKCLTRIDAVSANFCPSCGEDVRGLSPLSDTLSGPMTGKVIDGRYRLIEKLGEGGMGAVYKVEHARMGKVLALKVLRPDLAIDKKMKHRFQQEARVVSKLSHPNTISVFDFGELEDGSLYIAMEFLAGRDLSWMLRAHGPFSEERAASIGIQVLSSLAEAHELGIIHRDIKPANVMLTRRREGGDAVKVLDFGIAKLNEGEARKHITGVADFVGTPAYMSPEQGKGEALDARSDLYSVGAMLFELVTGRGVFDGPTPMSIVSKHMSDAPPRIAQVAPDKMISPAFEAVIRKALAKDRDDRFASAEQMRQALEKVRRDISNTLGDYTPAHELNTGEMASREDFDKFERSLKTRRIVAPVVTLCLLGAVGFGTWQFLVRPQPQAALTVEVEPNDDPDQANRIALAQPVTGMMGRSLSDAESDHDVFVVEVEQDVALTLELSGVADMNLVLEAFQLSPPEEKLARLVAIDDGRTGAGERVDGLRVRAGALYLRVQEKAHATEPVRPPRETTKLSYALTVRRTDGGDRIEDEPRNDRLETTVASKVDRAILGFAGSAIAAGVEPPVSAVDHFRVEEPADVRVFAVVVPPETGKLLLLDPDKPSLTKETRGAPVVMPLSKGALKVLPLFPSRGDDHAPTTAGAPYFVTFFADREGGLDGVLDLLSLLEGEERRAVRRQVVEAVRGALGNSALLTALSTD